MKTYCFALDLKDNSELIEQYKHYHRSGVISPRVVENIRSGGILSEEIFLLGTRMIKVLQTTDSFSLEAKEQLDRSNPEMQAWEDLMWRFQQPVPEARSGEKWVLMEKIFEV